MTFYKGALFFQEGDMCVLFPELLHTGDHLSLFLMPEGQLGVIMNILFLSHISLSFLTHSLSLS